MWPWGHLAFGALIYYGYRRIRRLGVSPVVVGIALAFGTQFPDIVDKPLAWNLGLLPNGRSLAHSIFTFFIVAVVLTRIGRDRERQELTTAFLIGYLSHIVGDFIPLILRGEFYYATFALWPLLPPVDYGQEIGFIARIEGLDVTLSLLVQLALVLVLIIYWFVRARAAHRPPPRHD